MKKYTLNLSLEKIGIGLRAVRILAVLVVVAIDFGRLPGLLVDPSPASVWATVCPKTAQDRHQRPQDREHRPQERPNTTNII